MIEMSNVTKVYGDTVAVDSINLQIKKGEVFGFLGPNGAGKTTTIKMMGGIIDPTEGKVTIGGVPMDEKPETAKMKIGFIPDRPFLYEKLTGMEFMKFTADLYEVENDDIDELAIHYLKMFSLHDWGNDLIEAYSHGMKQRLIFAAALLHSPEVLIVDEPMVGLDPAGIKMVKALFIELAKKGVTVFMSTHTLKIAEDVCDRIGIIRKGQLIAIGTAAELKKESHLEAAGLEEVFMKLTQEEPN